MSSSKMKGTLLAHPGQVIAHLLLEPPQLLLELLLDLGLHASGELPGAGRGIACRRWRWHRLRYGRPDSPEHGQHHVIHASRSIMHATAETAAPWTVSRGNIVEVAPAARVRASTSRRKRASE